MLESDQINELKKLFPNVQEGNEAGYTFFLIPDFKLPQGCIPQVADLLFCPMPRDGYDSRLFFSQQIQTQKPLNWNALNYRILEQNWFAFSWKVAPGMRLAQTLAAHLGGLRSATS